ncbi:type II toxin-antitoxin system RelE family toxin [Kyrpidia spormannii]
MAARPQAERAYNPRHRSDCQRSNTRSRKRYPPLQGVSGLCRMRVGDWRLIFTIRTEERIIEIVAVRPRGEAYRRL